jgi:F0F1-type ATP synthase membrane subunit b/b'
MAVFTETFTRLRQMLDDAQQSRQRLLGELRTEARELARHSEKHLAEQAGARRSEFTAMMENLRGTIREQARQTRSQLAELAADLRHGGQVFRQGARRRNSSLSPGGRG